MSLNHGEDAKRYLAILLSLQNIRISLWLITDILSALLT